MLGKLVVHLQGNYAHLTRSLSAARSEVVSAVSGIQSAVGNIAAGGNAFGGLEGQATQVAGALQTVANVAHGLDATLKTTASSAEVAATSIAGIGSGGNAFGGLQTQATQVAVRLETAADAVHLVENAMEAAAFSGGMLAGSLGRVGTVATAAGGGVNRLAGVSQVAGRALGTIASGARVVGSTLGLVSGALRTAAGGVLHLVHTMHAAQIVISLLSTAFRMLMVPLRMIGAAAGFVFRVFVVALKTVLLPVRLLFSALIGLARAIWAIVSPVASVALTIFKIWFVFKGWIGALRILYQWLGMLPPKLRLLVVGLMALGLAGKAGAIALRVFSVVVRVAATAVQLLLLPIQLLFNPMAALRSAANLLGRALLTTAGIARRAAGSFFALARSVGSAVGSVAGSIGGKLLGAAKAAGSAFVVAGAAVAAWGVKLAAKAETGAVVLGTMLKSMTAGKALQRDLENWSGAPLFDPDAIQLSGVQLFKAGVAADAIVGKLDQLGQIAVATKTPLDDLSRVYMQGMVEGKFGLGELNQLAHRGIAIYDGLTAATGKSGAALSELISDGKIGPKEMNAALEHLTSGTGIYAGAIGNVAQTTEGMWMTLKNKVSFAAREMGMNILTAFDFKGMMSSGMAFFGNLRGQIAAAMPAFKAAADVVKAYFFAIMEVWSVVIGAVTSSLGVTSGNWMETFLELAAIATWAFQNWPDIATLAFVNVGLALVRFGADFAHLFTGVMPALFSWFGANWESLFTTAASFVASVFTNMAKNIFATMKAVWDYIASGGTKSFSVAFTPLLEGFENTVSQLPNIPPRAIGELETQLAADSERLGESLGASLGDAIDANMKMLADFEAAQAAYVPPTLDGSGHADETPTESDGTGAIEKAKAVENAAVETRSAEGQKSLATLFSAANKENGIKDVAKATKKSNELLDDIKNNTRGSQLRGKAFAR